MKARRMYPAVAAALGLFPLAACATNGYWSHSYGIKSAGMAGVAIALPQDAMAGAANPAGLPWVAHRFDVGMTYFKPDRSAEITGNGFGLNGAYDGNGKSAFLLPEFGYNRMMRPDLAHGLLVYGNGGMNTRYEKSPFAAFGGPSPAGVTLEQLFIAPTIAWKIRDRYSIGATLNLIQQRFAADGLQPFAQASSNPSALTNRGYASSTGWSLRLGWTGMVTDALTLGATYQTKGFMGRFDSYSGLYADKGAFDIPANYGVGFAWRATPAWTIAADVQKIDYSGIAAIANPISRLTQQGVPLGMAGGPGFGWRDMTVVKIGTSYDVSGDLTLRGGVSFGRQPIPASETFFNLLAPGVVERHLSLGATWKFGKNKEVTAAYTHGFDKTVNGSGSIPANFGGGETNLRMHQDMLGISFGMRI